MKIITKRRQFKIKDKTTVHTSIYLSAQQSSIQPHFIKTSIRVSVSLWKSTMLLQLLPIKRRAFICRHNVSMLQHRLSELLHTAHFSRITPNLIQHNWSTLNAKYACTTGWTTGNERNFLPFSGTAPQQKSLYACTYTFNRARWWKLSMDVRTYKKYTRGVQAFLRTLPAIICIQFCFCCCKQLLKWFCCCVKRCNDFTSFLSSTQILMDLGRGGKFF